MSEEKRQFPRVGDTARLQWRVAPASSAYEEGMQLNISGGGVCFYTDTPVEEGTMLALQLELPSYPIPILALGRVVWSEPCENEARGRGTEIGVEFHWVGWDSSRAQQDIADYVKSRLE